MPASLQQQIENQRQDHRGDDRKQDHHETTEAAAQRTDLGAPYTQEFLLLMGGVRLAGSQLGQAAADDVPGSDDSGEQPAFRVTEAVLTIRVGSHQDRDHEDEHHEELARLESVLGLGEGTPRLEATSTTNGCCAD